MPRLRLFPVRRRRFRSSDVSSSNQGSPGTNPDFATQDLYDSIQNGTFPGWTMFAQVLSPEAAQSFKYNVLDLTKYVYSEIILCSRCSPGCRDWGFDNVAPVEIGKFYLTQNPAKYA